MHKIWQIFLILSAIVAAIFFAIKHERKSAQNEIIVEEQKEEIKIKNEVIETKKFQQKLVSKPDLSSDIDARNDWLQELWASQERAN